MRSIVTPVQRSTALAILVITACLIAIPGWAQNPDAVDLNALYKIKHEGFQNSQVMETIGYLTDVYGPRLTNSPNYRAAGQWAVTTMERWGLANVHREPWSFGQGWANQSFSGQAISPQAFPLIGYPSPWTPGTNGAVVGEAVIVTIGGPDDLEKYRGTLRGKYVMVDPVRNLPPHFTPDAKRFTDSELATIAAEPDPTILSPSVLGTYQQQVCWQQDLNRFFVAEGVAAVLHNGTGDDGTVFLGGDTGDYRAQPNPSPTVIYLAAEHYNRIARLLAKKMPVTLEFNIENKFDSSDLNAFNIVAEIPGSDKKDEVVMLGAHFDSWTFGTGATDNGAGSAVMMEAIRILKASGLKMRRTVRLALWGGEEEGLLGSRTYVAQHYTNPDTMQLKPEYSKLAAYFNLDSGTGEIRGVYLQHNDAVVPIFKEWMQPFHNMNMNTVGNSVRGGTTDHLPFDDVGLPGFRFIQDSIDYSRTHHSNMDVYDRIVPADMMENAVIVATFIYQAANREQALPRKTIPAAHASPYAFEPCPATGNRP